MKQHVFYTKQHMLFKLKDILDSVNGLSVTRIPDHYRNTDCT